jgi:hydroxymethylpyrimidine/phosphomethylpyrimidine kinase
MNILAEPEATEKAPSVIVAGGLDPSGGAGLAADIIAIHSAGVLALPVATALTVQDSSAGYGSHPVDAEIIEEQLAAIIEDFKPAYIKLGLVGSKDAAYTIAEFAENYDLKMVLDPVMATSTGTPLIDSQTKEAIGEYLVPKSYLITPNAPEAESLTGVKVNDKEGARAAAVKLLAMGAANVLITGGHITDEISFSCVDYLYNGEEFVNISANRESRGEIRGTGCHLASSITAHLALGYELQDAIIEAKKYVTKMIRQAVRGGEGASQAL